MTKLSLNSLQSLSGAKVKAVVSNSGESPGKSPFEYALFKLKGTLLQKKFVISSK